MVLECKRVTGETDASHGEPSSLCVLCAYICEDASDIVHPTTTRDGYLVTIHDNISASQGASQCQKRKKKNSHISSSSMTSPVGRSPPKTSVSGGYVIPTSLTHGGTLPNCHFYFGGSEVLWVWGTSERSVAVAQQHISTGKESSHWNLSLRVSSGLLLTLN